MDLPLIETGQIAEMKVSWRDRDATIRPLYGFMEDWVNRPILGWVVLLSGRHEYVLPALLPSCEDACRFAIAHLKRLDKAHRKQAQREDSFNERTLHLCQAYPPPPAGFYQSVPHRTVDEDIPVGYVPDEDV